MADATATTTKKAKRTNAPAKPKPVFLLYNVVDATGNPVPGAKLTDITIEKSADALVDKIAAATDAGEEAPSYVRFFLPKAQRAPKAAS